MAQAKQQRCGSAAVAPADSCLPPRLVWKLAAALAALAVRAATLAAAWAFSWVHELMWPAGWQPPAPKAPAGMFAYVVGGGAGCEANHRPAAIDAAVLICMQRLPCYLQGMGCQSNLLIQQ